MPDPLQRDKKSNFFSEWLEQLQQESWQLELLISGLALFGIWESRGVIRRISYYLDVNFVSDYSLYVGAFQVILWAGWTIFLVNLLIHIIIRGLWIGAIGLRYVSGDIDFETLGYSEVFSRYLKRRIGSFDEYIERLEKLSSVLFSFTFLLFFMFFSFMMVNLAFAVVANLATSFIDDKDSSQMGFLGFMAIAFYGIGLLVLIDFISLGAFKKVKDKTFATVYLWIYRFYSTLSLSFIYRPLLLNFIDDKYTRKLFFLAIPYSLIILVGFKGANIEAHGYLPTFDTRYDYQAVATTQSINWIYYDDLREQHMNSFSTGNEVPEKENIRTVSLANYKVDKDYIELFIEYRDTDTRRLKENGLIPFRKRGILHSLFYKGDVDNPAMAEIDSLQAVEMRILRDIIRNEEEVDTLKFAPYKANIERWKGYAKENISDARDELRRQYKDRRELVVEQQMKAVKDQLLERYLIRIDDDIVTPTSSDFYTHPNMHERGLLVYFGVDSLSKGQHRLNVSFSGDDRLLVSIPFIKE